MARETFEQELQRLQDEMLAMAGVVEGAITESVKVLALRDMEGSRRLIEQDRLVNQKRFALEADCLVVVATQQPLATDLRVVAAILFVTDELERIGDYAKGIARINLMIGEHTFLKPLDDLSRMAERARSMLHRALEAFVQRDAVAARAIPVEDDEIDALLEKVNRELLNYILADPNVLEQANLLLWAAHNLERTADRVTNLCERVIFTVTGELVELNDDYQS